MKRSARLNKISEFVQDDNTPKTEIMDVVTEIREKFKDRLAGYSYLSDINDLQKGYLVAYVDLNLESVKSGIVVNIMESEYGTRTYIRLKNAYDGHIWMIKATKHYVFYTRPFEDKLLRMLAKRNDIDIDIDKIKNG